MKPGNLHLTIIKGGVFRQRLTWKAPPAEGGDPAPLNLTGYTGRAQIRVGGRAVLTLDSAGGADGTITFDAAGGIELYAPAAAVSAATAGAGVWSLEVEPPGGDRIVLLSGGVTITAEATR